MRIKFDPNKDVANMARHGISLKYDTYRTISLRKATPKK